MSFQVRIAGPARSYLDRLDPGTQDRFDRKFEELSEDPFDPRHSKPLAGPGSLRVARVGLWRIVFSVARGANAVVINDIAPRGQVYRRL